MSALAAPQSDTDHRFFVEVYLPSKRRCIYASARASIPLGKNSVNLSFNVHSDMSIMSMFSGQDSWKRDLASLGFQGLLFHGFRDSTCQSREGAEHIRIINGQLAGIQGLDVTLLLPEGFGADGSNHWILLARAIRELCKNSFPDLEEGRSSFRRPHYNRASIQDFWVVNSFDHSLIGQLVSFRHLFQCLTMNYA